MIHQYRINRFVVILLTVICSMRAFAGVEPYTNQLKGAIKKDDIVTVKDEKFKNPLFDWSKITNRTVKNFISLEITHDHQIVLNTAFSVEVDLKVEYYSTPGQAAPTEVPSVKLKINFDPQAGATYKAKDVYSFTNGYDVKVTVNSINSPELGTNIPAVLQLTNQVVIDRQYTFEPDITSVNFTTVNFSEYQTGSGNTTTPPNFQNGYFLNLAWASVQGAEEYDIEWAVFDHGTEKQPVLDKVIANQNPSENELESLFRNNATRVTTDGQTYDITMVYNADYIMVRIRQVHYTNGIRLEDKWDYKKGSVYAILAIQDLHQENLNWQYSATFAEEGKKKEVVSYFDGSLRSRQMVTINNSDQVAVVQESVYDEFGRAAANILPAPTDDNKFHFYPNFNRNTSNTPYDYNNLRGTPGVNCEMVPGKLGDGDGAAKYYSASNSFLTKSPGDPLYRKYNSYIPNAEGFPISVKQFTNDNTGRVRIQGAVGPRFQPGAPNPTDPTDRDYRHVTKYYYGKPESWELDRLFGNDVGYANHYQKNMVVDPNGQISISYLNASGKTIATALTGDEPKGMDALLSKPQPKPETFTILRPQQFVFDVTALSIKAKTTYLSSVVNASATFDYDIQKLIYTYQGPAFQVCSNCYYDLTIRITNDCGQPIYTSGPNPIQIGTKDGDCNYVGSPYAPFTVQFQGIGEYYISFELKLSKDVINAYADKYIEQRDANNDLKKEVEFVLDYLNNTNFDGCFNECTTCEAALGTETQFTQAIISKLNDYQVSTNSAALNTFISGLYSRLHTQCLALKASCMVSSCSRYEEEMLEDVSPGGQYALFGFEPFMVIEQEINVISLNWRLTGGGGIFPRKDPSDPDYQAEAFTDENGNITSPYDENFTLEMLVKYWKPEWATKFLQFHPEKCKLDFCNANSNYIMWDDQVQQFINKAADIPNIPGTSGLAYSYTNGAWLLAQDPFFKDGAPGAVYRSQMQSDLNNFSANIMKVTVSGANVKGLTQVIDYLLYCADLDGSTNSGPTGDSWNNCTPVASCRVPNKEWDQYKEIYFQLKQKYYQLLRSNTTCGDKCPVGKPYSFGSCATANDFGIEKAIGIESCEQPGTQAIRITYKRSVATRWMTLQLYYPTEFGAAPVKPTSIQFAPGQSEKIICVSNIIPVNTIKVQYVTCDSVAPPPSCTGVSIPNGQQLSNNKFQLFWTSGQLSTFHIVPGKANEPPATEPYCQDGTLIQRTFFSCLKFSINSSGIPFQYTNVWLIECRKDLCANAPIYNVDQQLDTYKFYKNGQYYYVKLASGGATPECAYTPNYQPCIKVQVGNNTPLVFTNASVHTCDACTNPQDIFVKDNIGVDPLTYRGLNDELIYVYENTWDGYTPPSMPCANEPVFYPCLRVRGKITETFYNATVITCSGTQDPCAGALELRASADRASNSWYYNNETGHGYYTIYESTGPDQVPQTDCPHGDLFGPYECVRVYIGINTLTFQNVWVLDCNNSLASAATTFADGGYGIIYCPDAYRYKKPRFPEIDYNSNFTLQNMIDMQNENNMLIEDQVKTNCEAQADRWISQLSDCLAAYSQPQRDAKTLEIRAKLIEVCTNGGDTDHPFGASTVRPGVTSTASFKQAMIDVFGSNALTMTCNPWLLDEPHPYEPKQQSASVMLGKTNASLCARLQQLRTDAAGANLFDYLTNKYGNAMNLSRTELAMMEKSCDNCRFLLEDNIPLPVFMEPGTFGCITKADYDNAKAALQAELGTNFDASHVNYPDMLANFLNHRWGFSMAAFRYQEYEALSQSNQSAILCNNVPYTQVEVDPYVCLKSLVEAAIINGRRDWLAYIEEEKRLFRLNYISTCSQAQASAKMTTVQQTYHYTLYYYDQAGNLIRTVSPEGVRFLSDEEMTLVDGYRKSDDLVDCTNMYTQATENKTTVLNKFSTALQNGSAKSLELWLSGTGFSRHVRFITPDHKYLYQAAINNNKLWVELYTMQPEAGGVINLTLSNHAVADLAGTGIPEWSHLVVQSNNFTSGQWDLYLNNKQLTLLPDASAPGYPFAWEIAAGYTLPAEEINQLRHIRVYDRLIQHSEIAVDYVQPCRAPEGALKVQSSPLIVWGRLNYAATCNSNIETRTVSNRGALEVNGPLSSSGDGNWFQHITNNFTVEMWVNPQEDHEIDLEGSYTGGVSGQKFAIFPAWGGPSSTNKAGMGISVGKNGVSVYEHADGYMPSILVWEGVMTGWHHVAVVYDNKKPFLYIDGQLRATAAAGSKTYVSPSYNFCSGPYGSMKGSLDEVRVWDRVRSQTEIANDRNKSISPSTSNLVAYWPMSSTDGQYPYDVTCAHVPVRIQGNFTYNNATSSVQDLVAVETVLPGVYPRHRLTTSYAYNSASFIVQQKSPDGGHSYFWYDMLSRMVASQNEEQRAPHDNENPNRYSYTEYDAIGRKVEVGEKSNLPQQLPVSGFLTINDLTAFNGTGTKTEITQTVYDKIPIAGLGVQAGLLQKNLRKRVSATLYKDTYGGPVLQATYYSYDLTGYVETLWQQVDGVALKKIDYEFDQISGKSNFIRYQHGENDQFYYAYKHDAENRLIEASSGTEALINERGSILLNGQIDAFYQYYLHGPLARTELGKNKVQGLDYAYTLKGWTKGINGHNLNATTEMGEDGNLVARDVMTYTLGYYQNDYKPIGASAVAFPLNYSAQSSDVSGNELFNGNVSHMTVALSKFRNGDPVGYTYHYDQLNRLKTMLYHPLSASTTSWNINTKEALNAYGEIITYDGNGNINTYLRNGANSGSMLPAMDNLKYSYTEQVDPVINQKYKVHNQLQQVAEINLGIDGNYSQALNGVEDIDGQTNYEFDKIGNLVKEQISPNNFTNITWTVYGRIKSITKNVAGTQTFIAYSYDATGNRVKKVVTVNNVPTTTWYTRDAQGNSLAIYSDKQNNQAGIWWQEQQLYGNNRLGMWTPNINIISTNGTSEWGILGQKAYELTNHLGNVLATVNDITTGVDAGTDNIVDYYTATVLSASDYYPFGMQMPDRIFNNGNYRYGFNGKENDNELDGVGNQQDYGLRIYDPRIAKFLSVDPLTKDYPWWTPYQFAGNSPISFIDLDGAELSKKLEDWGVKLPPIAAGFVDGLVENISIIAMGKLAWNLGTDAKFRDEFVEAIKTAATDPVGFAQMIFEDYKQKAQNIIAWNEQGQYELGSMAGELVGNVVSGAAATKLISYATKFKSISNKVLQKAENLIKQKPCGCFTEGTTVLTSKGYKPIEQIAIGDSVWAYSDSLHVMKLQRVIHVFTQTFDQYFVIYFKGHKLEVTHEHPFYVHGKWTKAQDLIAGDTLTTFNNLKLSIDSIRFIQKSNPITVYNFTVEGYHTYYVSESSILVHNGNPCLNLKNWTGFTRKYGKHDFKLEKQGMTHIMERHHPDYWDGSIKPTQTFLSRDMTPDKVKSAIESIMNQNHNLLTSKKSNKGMFQIKGTYGGKEYTVGFKDGKVGQFYPNQ
ncbi:hypothetical protein FAM09_17250 [Niastella caeni]|uniref:Uncharacterized protein n=1 Tax=Niastella caeni TaxID=2569763 RepID=A0A4V4H0Y8_9BACT|nr:polymorphic toxin-type HINT domain-containing protein [Niastella caeni]THU38416.1 hypothetical protein FAM09_17250 [Niastella caeni]